MKTKVRVNRHELIKVVEARTRKAENIYKRDVKAHPAKVEAWQTACVTKLEKTLDAARAGRMPADRYGNPTVALPNKPVGPSEGREVCNLRRMLATLKMGTEDSLLLSQEDADAYFGPCTL